MTRRQRVAVVPMACLLLGGCLLYGLTGLPSFGGYAGEYGRLLSAVATSERHASNVVAAVTFDFRGLDTLGEEFILFSSVVGVAFILRGKLEIEDQRPLDSVSNDATRVVGLVMVPVCLVVGLWLAAYGYVTPGGGFQGGVVIAAALSLLWAASSYRDYAALTPAGPLDAVEGLGAGSFVVVGLVGLGTDAAFLANFLPLGQAGTLASSGTIAVLNWAAALEVAAANILLGREFLQEYVQTFPGVEEQR